MQKFKVSKDEIRAAMHRIGHEGDFIFVEGELLEGGTVEKCQHGPEALGCAICFEDDGTATGFNRETPKKEVQVPEKIKPSRDVDWELGNKINQILDYLASRE